VAYAAVKLNLFGDDLYRKKGGKGKVKDILKSITICKFKPYRLGHPGVLYLYIQSCTIIV